MTLLSVLLSITVYSAVIYAGIMLFRLLFKKHVSPSMMYLVWFILIARLLIPVTLESGFSLITLPPSAQAQAVVNVPANEPGNGASGGLNSGAITPEDSLAPGEMDELNGEPETAAQPGFTMSLPAVLTAVWVLGMALMLIQALAASVKLRARLIRDSVPVPEEWLAIADRVKADLNVRGKIRILMIRNFVSPALNASLFPVILIPDQMAGQDAEKIEFALRHEITHLKRKDHLVSLLLILLRIIYWFNPVVWLASRQIKLDMETACDRAVVNAMNREETARYASTVLDMYASDKVRFVLGMSLCSTRKTAERRVRGIFMRRHSSCKAKIAAVVLAAVMLVACFTTACQPVPGPSVTDTGGNPSQTAPTDSPPPSGTETPSGTVMQTIVPTATISASPSDSATPDLTPTAPPPEPVATLPSGVTTKARFTADTNGDGVDETIVVGVKSNETVSIYVLYVGGYHKINVEGDPFQTFKSAYLTQTAAGELCLLVSIDEASEDYLTFPVSFNGTTPVLHDEAVGYAYNVSGTQVTLSGHMDVIGTWDYTCKYKLNNNFTLQKTSDYTIVMNWMQPLHTIRELPVEMYVDGAYVADTLPAGTTLTPVQTDRNSYMTFKLGDGSTGRILFTRGENVEVYINGVIESEYFDNIAYSD